MRTLLRRSLAVAGAALLVAGGAVSATAAEAGPGDTELDQLMDIQTQDEFERQEILEQRSVLQTSAEIEVLLYSNVAVATLMDAETLEIIAAIPIDENGAEIQTDVQSFAVSSEPSVYIEGDEDEGTVTESTSEVAALATAG